MQRELTDVIQRGDSGSSLLSSDPGGAVHQGRSQRVEKGSPGGPEVAGELPQTTLTSRTGSSSCQPSNRLPDRLRLAPDSGPVPIEPAPMDISSLSPPTWWPKEFESDGEAGRLRRAWCAYPPEAVAYLDFVRGVLRTASLAAFGVPDRIAQGVIDYASPREGSTSHRGAAWNNVSGWIDPSYETLGSCSREDTEPLVLQEQPYRVSLHRRELSLVNLQRPNWTGPNDEASFHARVISPLVELTDAEDHLYTWLSLFFADCHGQNVAYVSQYVPSAGAQEVAAAYGVQLIHLSLREIEEAEREAQRWFHFLHLTRAQWEALLRDLAAGKRPSWYRG